MSAPAAHVLAWCLKDVSDLPYLASAQSVLDSLGQSNGVPVEAKMTQHHSAAVQHSNRVGSTLAGDINSNVASSWLKHGECIAVVDAGNETSASDETSTDVADNVTVEVRGDKHIKLLRFANLE